MHKVVSKGKTLLDNWGVRPAQGNLSASPAQGTLAMAPKQKKAATSEAATKKAATSEVAPSGAAAGAMPRRRATGKIASEPSALPHCSEAGSETVAPPAAVKPERVKKEPTPKAILLSQFQKPPDPSTAPPAGELQRMVSCMKAAAARGEGEQLAEYQSFASTKEKRMFYYNTFLPGNPMKETSKAFKRLRESERTDADKTKDWGWVSRDFAAGKLELTRWREIPEQKIQLEFRLAKLEKRTAEYAHLLEDHMDKHEYHFVQLIQSTTESNKRKTVVEEDRALDQETYDSAMVAIDGLEGGKAITGTVGSNRRGSAGSNRRPSPTEDTRDPAWLTSFKKECTRNFATQKRAAEQALSNAEQTIRLVDEKPHCVANNDLLKAYVKTIKNQIQSLKHEDYAAAQFLVKHEASSSPKTEEAATAAEKDWKEAANNIKGAKTAFLSACTKMLADLRVALSKV